MVNIPNTKSIPFKLSLITTLMLLFISVIYESFLYFDTAKLELDNLNNTLLNEAQEFSEEVEFKTQQRIKFISVLSQLIADDLELPSDHLQSILQKALNEVNFFHQGLVILSPDGKSIITATSSSTQILMASNQFEWFEQAKQNAGVVISEVFRSNSAGKLQLIFAKAIHDISGTITGVLAAPVLISTELLSNLAKQTIADTLTESVILSTSDKIVIASSKKEPIFKPIPNQLFYQFYQNTNNLAGHNITVNEEGTTDLVAFSTIKVLNWVVILQSNATKALSQIRKDFFKEALSELLILLFINIVVIFATLRVYFSPLLHSAKQVRNIDLDKELPHLKRVRNDEIGDLLEGFNCLVDAVNERTLKLKEANSHLQELSKTDALTGVFNRRWFDNSLKNLWSIQQRNKQPLSLIILDIDFFKQYNDSYGHLQGDRCLATVGRQLNGLLRRPTDIFARYGGEEFAAIVENDEAGALDIAETMRQSIESLAMEHTKSPCGIVTISLGVATLVPDLNSSPELLIKYADRALYRSKEQGRNKVSVYVPD